MDTIKFIIDINDVPDNYQQFMETLETYACTYKNNTFKMTGHIDNFFITYDNRGVRVMGSLTRYIYGDNFRTASISQLAEGFEKLCSAVHLDLGSAKVGRVDFAENILVKFPVKDYLNSFIHLRYFNRHEYPTNLKFVSANRFINIYDKVAEAKHSNVKIDEVFKDKNFLRFEFGYTNHSALCSFLKLRKCTFKDVLRNYPKLIDEWLRQYNLIQKEVDGVMFDFDKLHTSKDIMKELQIQGILRLGGLKEVLRMIDVGKRRGYFNSHKDVASNIRSKLKEITVSRSSVKESKLMEELNRKMSLVHFHAYPKCNLQDCTDYSSNIFSKVPPL